MVYKRDRTGWIGETSKPDGASAVAFLTLIFLAETTTNHKINTPNPVLYLVRSA